MGVAENADPRMVISSSLNYDRVSGTTRTSTRPATVSSNPAYQKAVAYAWGRPSPASESAVGRKARDTTER